MAWSHGSFFLSFFLPFFLSFFLSFFLPFFLFFFLPFSSRGCQLPVSFLPTRLGITPDTVVRSPAPFCCFLGITRTCHGSGYCPHCGVAESEHGVPDLPVMRQLGSHRGTGREASSNVQGRSSRRSKVGWLGAMAISSSFPLFLFHCCSLPPSSLALSLSPSFPLLLFRCYQLPVSVLPTRLGITPDTVDSVVDPVCCLPRDHSTCRRLDLVTALTAVWRRVSTGFPHIHWLWGS
jgi:hypothetical protein